MMNVCSKTEFFLKCWWSWGWGWVERTVVQVGPLAEFFEVPCYEALDWRFGFGISTGRIPDPRFLRQEEERCCEF